MEDTNSRKKMRIEKKQRKLEALANIVKLNEEDRKQETQDDSMPSGTQTDDDGFIKVTRKKKRSSCPSESANKRQKIVSEDESYDPDVNLPQQTSNKRQKPMSEDRDAESDVTSDQEPAIKKQKTTTEDKNTISNAELKNPTLTNLEIKQAKREERERKRQWQRIPEFALSELGQKALLSVSENERKPIFLTDLQHLVMLALLGQNSPCRPDRWCYMTKPQQISHTVVVCLEGLSLYHYLSNESKFEKINQILETRLEVILPNSKKEGESVLMIEEFTQVPLTNVQACELIQKHGSLDAAVELNKDPTLLINGIFPVEEKSIDPEYNDIHPNDKFPRTKLLLSALQLVDENYPMPLRGELCRNFSSFVMTKDKYSPVTNRSPLFGLDCEMCRTSVGANELTRISIVNENYECVYETFVRPKNKIIDYLTPFSGITEEVMITVSKTLKDVHEDVRKILPPDAILVGQSLNCDLHAMRMMHPYIIDTSVCFNMSGVRQRKTKLQKLAMTFLQETIQDQDGGHDSMEDCVSSLKLVKMKLQNGIEFGDTILTRKKHLHDIIQLACGDTIRNDLLAHASTRDKRTAIITSKPLPSTIQSLLMKVENGPQVDSLKRIHVHELSSNKEAVSKCKGICMENALTLCNLHITPEELLASSFDNTIECVDKWISKIWKSMANNGLLIVLMGGAPECATGVAHVAVKAVVPSSVQ